MIRVNLVHEDHLLRFGIRKILENTTEIEIAHEACTNQEGISGAQQFSPLLVILSVKLVEKPEMTVVPQLLGLQPTPKLLIVSLNLQELTSPLPAKGAAGYLTSQATPEELINAVKTISSGKSFISNHITQHLQSRKEILAKLATDQELSPQEIEVWTLLAMGKTVSEAANRLSISPRTIHSYRDRLFQKLGVQNDVQLTWAAIKQGLVTNSE